MALTLIEQVKVMVGDLGTTSILSDDVYQHFLDKYNDNVNRASVDAAKTILFYLASWPTRERTGDIEVWRQWASNYREALTLFLNNAAVSQYNPVPYAGGISKSDMKNNDLNHDNVRVPIYQGKSTGERVYNDPVNDTRDESLDFYDYDDDRRFP